MGEARRKQLAANLVQAAQAVSTKNPMTRSVQRGERYASLTLTFARPPSKADINRIRAEVQPWDMGENFAAQFEAIPWRDRPVQLGIQWKTPEIEADPDKMEQVRYAMRLFLGLGEELEHGGDAAIARSLFKGAVK